MLFQRISRTSPEKVFGVFKNTDTVARVDGDLVIHNLTLNDGNSISPSAAAATQLTCVGVVSGNIAVDDYGLVQVYGYHPNVKAIAGVTAGAAIKSGTTALMVMLGAAADDPVAQIGIALTATANGRIKAFLRCM